MVKNTIFKKDFTIRYRQCPKCKKKFKTIEQVAHGWDYKAICKKIKDELREVKF